jgi:SnoaL-like domain
MSSNMTVQDRNEQLIRRLYQLAEAASNDTQQFVSLFADGGYFYDVSGGKKYYGADIIGLTVDVYAAASPDMHRELDSFYFDDNVIIMELSLNGTHKGDLVLPAGTIPATGKEIHAPCCDIFHIEKWEGHFVSLLPRGDHYSGTAGTDLSDGDVVPRALTRRDTGRFPTLI